MKKLIYYIIKKTAPLAERFATGRTSYPAKNNLKYILMKKLLIILSFTGLCIFSSCNSCAKNSDEKESREMKLSQSFVLEKIWETDSVFRTPESVIYDEKREILYVSNLNRDPSGKDKRGFISKLSKSGEVINLHWIGGLKEPKGMAITGDKLYVADLDQMVIININGDRIEKKIDIQDAKYLNDMAADTNGDLYFSDSESHSIYRYRDGEAEVWLAEGLSRPNGLYIEKDRVLLTSSISQDFVSIDKTSKTKEIITTEIGRGDGLVYTGMPGYYIVSDWSGEVFIILPDKRKLSLLRTKDMGVNSADIGYIPSENLLLVPTFLNNRVVAYRLIAE